MKDHIHTVGLIDDHVLVRNALVGLIESFGGYKVTIEASNGVELMHLLVKKKLPEILVMDVNMPGMDGFETCAVLLQQHPAAKILALSMHGEESVIVKMITAGAKGYLLKSAEPAEVKSALRMMVENRFYLPDSVSASLALGLQSEEHRNPVQLNEREIEFLQLLGLELSHKEIGSRMNVSKRTVDYYRDELFKKLNVNTRVGLIKYAIKHDLI
jgi:two-component system, NarL family, invasion response regulator UvrY